jgi:cytochrome c553
MRLFVTFATAALMSPLVTGAAGASADAAIERQFNEKVGPFLETYCVSCHGKDKTEAELDLSTFRTMAAVLGGHEQWALVLERLEEGDMPSKKAKQFPSDEARAEVVAWIQTMRKNEALKNAGDPGPVLARRLSTAEYDYSIADLTGANIRPTKEFPVDPANQAGFDNTGESLTMSPALLKKYLGAARTVADHLVLKPDGFTFAPHPVVADTDRDKYAVLRIVDFYKRQPTSYTDYFMAAWRYRERAALGQPGASLDEIAAKARLSAKYLKTVWALLSETESAGPAVGPIAKLQGLWRTLPARDADAALAGCERMREFVVGLREKIVPEVKNLSAPPIQDGSQTLVLWKDRQMAANRRKYDVAALQIEGASPKVEDADDAKKKQAAAAAAKAKMAATSTKAAAASSTKAPATPNLNAIIQTGGVSLPPAIVTKGSSATVKRMSARDRGADADLHVPADPVERARYEAAFARFASVFPDAFYITERARVYLDAEKEQKNEGRLLSAGLHSMTGYFRDDGPLYDLVLDDAGRRELDQLWQEFDFLASVPQRMHSSFTWFERTDSSFMRDDEFTPYRPEDKSITTQTKIKSLGELYYAKAKANNASAVVLGAVKEHFEIVAANIRRVEAEREAAVPSHLKALKVFAERAYRRPLTAREQDGLLAFYRLSREENGLDHEDAMRDCIASVLMSPNFCYRADLVAESAGADRSARFQPLSDYALASRLSYFLWSSLPDAELLAHAATGDLHRPEVLAAQARRLLRDGHIRNFAVEFGGHWLDFRRFEEHNAVDRERFPSFDNELRQAMFEEPVRFLIDLAREDRPVLNCLYADYTFVNAPLAKHYGMTAATTSASEWVRVDQAGKFERGGLLPMAVFLTANSPGLRTSPVKRGYWVVRRVLGERIPPPPAAVPDLPSDEKNLGELTLRQTLAHHRENATCASCHARFDSFGLVFEGFGPVGERREKDFGGRPVDTRAEFPGGADGAGLAGLRTYVKAKREQDFVDNLCRKLIAYGLGRTLLPSDDTLVAEMKTRLASHEGRFGELVEALVTSPQFRTKRALPSVATTTATP